MRVVSTSYMALVDKNRLKDKLSSNSSWLYFFMLEDENSYHATLDNGLEEIKFIVEKNLEI